MKDIKLLKRTLIFENSKNQAFSDHIEWKDGQSVKDYLVVAPKVKTQNLVTGVSILPVFEGKFGLIRVYRHAIADLVWEVPRGFIDEGESLLASARRELKEETGLICEGDMKSMGVIAPEAGTMAARVQLFVALNCVKEESFNAEEFGHQELRFFSSPEVNKMIMNSEIQDPGTIIIFLKLN
jgi:ADP-ribose pyrophosphatase